MGFPKPWPTEWPDPRPDTPDEVPGDDELPDDDPDVLPEFRARFQSVTWAVNHACNLRCTHCYDVVSYRRHDLSTEDALRMIDRLHAAGVSFIAFSGGEAFLRKDLFQLMERCRDYGMQVGARSNGTRITAAVAKRLKDLGVVVVGVSFDGATPETHDAVRGAGAFQAALSGLGALIAVGIRAQMEVVLSKHNAHEAEAFIALGEAVAASEVNFSAITPQGRGAQRASDLLDHADWLHLSALLRQASYHASMPVTPNCAFVGTCWANIEPHITCDGWMTPCYLSATKLFNVLEVSPQEIRTYLERDRHSYQDVCGRKAWTRQPRHATVIPLYSE